ATSLAGAGRRVLVVLPMPPVLRSALEEGGSTVVTATAATAAVTAAGTILLVGPQLPLGHFHKAASPVAARATAAATSPLGPSFWTLTAPLMAPTPRAASSRMLRDRSVAPTSLVFRTRAAGAAAGAGASDSTVAPSLPPSSAVAGTTLVPP